MGKRSCWRPLIFRDMQRYTTSCEARSREKPHEGAERIRTGKTGEIQTWNRGLEVGRQLGHLLLMPDARLQTLIQEGELLEVKPIPGCGDHVIGDQRFGLLILIDKLQGDMPVLRLSGTQLMTDENRHPIYDPVFQPPASGGTE